MQVAGFLRRELPIRMAHRVADLEGVPVLKDMKSVQSVKEAYMQSILEIMAFDENIDTVEKEEQFAALIENIYERHASVLVQSKQSSSLYKVVALFDLSLFILFHLTFSCIHSLTQWLAERTNFVKPFDWKRATSTNSKKKPTSFSTAFTSAASEFAS